MHPRRVFSILVRGLALLIVLLILVILVAQGILDRELIGVSLLPREMLMLILLLASTAALAYGVVRPKLGGLVATVCIIAFLGADIGFSLYNAAVFSRGQWFIFLMLFSAILLMSAGEAGLSGKAPVRGQRRGRPGSAAEEQRKAG
jgi:hypothetical protein